MSPKVPKAYLDARREEIIAAAYNCFADKGFHNTTMQDIYNATKLSPGAVYNYFSSKEDIVVAAVNEYSVQSINTISSLISENPDESFIKYFKFLFSWVNENDMTKWFSIELDFYSEATRNEGIRKALIKNMDDAGAKLIGPVKQNQRDGLFNPKLNPLSVAHVMVGMVFAAAIHKMIEPDFDLANYRRVCEAMLKGTFSTPPARRLRKSQL